MGDDRLQWRWEPRRGFPCERAARAGADGLLLSTEGTVDGPSSGLAELDALFSDTAELAANAVFGSDGTVDVDDIRVASGANILTGNVRVGGGRLATDWNLTVPSVAPVLAAVGAAADGGLVSSGRVEGPLDRLSLRADISVDDAQYDGFAIPELSARLELDDLVRQPVGTVRVDGVVAHLPADLETGLASLDGGGMYLGYTGDGPCGL